MADGVAISAGAGTTILTDDCTTGHAQIVKLAYSADGTATVITADANGLEIQGAGTAGSAAGGVVSVQGVASGTVVPVSDGGGTLTVDGTVAVTNAGITSIDGKITTCNTGAVAGSVTCNAGTNLNTSALATAAKQPALGTAGTPSADVITVQGVTSMTALKVDGSAVTQPVSNAGITSIDGKVTACNTGAVVLAAGTAEVGKLAAGTALIGKVGIDQVTANANEVVVKSITAGDTNIGNVDVASMPTDTFAADAQAYGKGVLIQGDDGTDRRAILVGTDGHVQVDVLSAPTTAVTNAGITTIAGAVAGTEMQVDVVAALPAGTNLLGKVGPGLPAYTRVTASIDYTASQTAATVWDPAAGKKFVITDAIVSATGAGQLSIFDGTDSAENYLVELNLSVNGGWDHAFGCNHWASSTADNILKYTSGAGATGRITVHGYEI